MRQGQHVVLKVDAYPDANYEGEVGSFSPATGSTWSLLPADNATGNFVKVVQRVPVKIAINGNSAMPEALVVPFFARTSRACVLSASGV